MAQPITYRAVRERFQMPEPEPVSGNTAVAAPDVDELISMAVEQERSRMGEDALARLLPQPEAPTDQNAAILDLVGPQEAPAMVKPPTLHTPDELADAGPSGIPTYSRTPEPRGEVDRPAVGRERSKLGMLAKIAGVVLPALDAAARGAAAGERAGSFLGGFGAASEAEERRQMRNAAFDQEQRQRDAQTRAIEQRSAMQQEQMELERQNQEILRFQKEAQARYMETITAQIAQQMKLKPQQLRLDQMNVFARMAADKAREETQRMMVASRLALSPEEAALKLEQAETQRAMQEYYRSGVGLRESQAGLADERAEHVGQPTTTQGVRMPSPTALAKDIMAIQKELRERYVDRKNNVDEAAMRKDPDFQRLQDLEGLYQQSLRMYQGQQTETGAGGGLLDRNSFIADFRQEEGRDPTPQEVERLRGVAWQ